MSTQILRRLTIAIAAVFMISSSAFSQDVWNLERCINHAMENNLDMRQSRTQIDQAKINSKQAQQSRYPSLNGSTNLSLNFGRTIDPTSNDFITQSFLSNNLSLSTGVTLYSAGRINNTIKQADVDQQAAKYTVAQTERDIALLVAQTYLSVLFAEENLLNTLNQLSLTNEQYNQIKKLVDAGVRPANELLDIEAQIALNEQNVITQENVVNISRLNLKQLLMLEPGYQMVLDKPQDVEIVTDSDLITFDQIYGTALNNQPGIRAAELNMESAVIGEKIARSALYPSVSFGGNIGTNFNNRAQKIDGFTDEIQDVPLVINGTSVNVGFPNRSANLIDNPYFSQLDENLSYGFGLGVNVPIYNNYTTRGNIERAKLNSINSGIQIERQKNLLKTNVQQALADAQAAAKSFAASKKSRDAQQAAFSNAQKRFDLGSSNSFDYVNARALLNNAEINLIISKYDYLFKAKVVDFYMGRPISLN